MSPNVTFKSTEDRDPQAAAPGQALAQAPSLADVTRTSYTASHGTAPDPMPDAPYGLLDGGPAAALRGIGPEREEWIQRMQNADASAAPRGGGVASSLLDGIGRLGGEGNL